MGGSASSVRTEEDFHREFEELRRESDITFGAVTIYRNRKNPKLTVMVKERMFNSEESVEAFVSKAKSRMNMKGENIAPLIELIIKEDKALCSSNYKVLMAYEFQERTLEKVLRLRKTYETEDKLCLSEEDAWGILRNLVHAAKLYRDKGFTHGDIQPSSIFVMSDKTLKLVDTSFMNEQESGYTRRYHDFQYRSTLSPQALAMLTLGPKYATYDKEKNDVWSIGMTTLVSLINEDFNIFYDWTEQEINCDLLNNRINKVQSMGYSPQFLNVLNSMLEKEEYKRPKLDQVISQIQSTGAGVNPNQYSPQPVNIQAGGVPTKIVSNNGHTAAPYISSGSNRERSRRNTNQRTQIVENNADLPLVPSNQGQVSTRDLYQSKGSNYLNDYEQKYNTKSKPKAEKPVKDYTNFYNEKPTPTNVHMNKSQPIYTHKPVQNSVGNFQGEEPLVDKTARASQMPYDLPQAPVVSIAPPATQPNYASSPVEPVIFGGSYNQPAQPTQPPIQDYPIQRQYANPSAIRGSQNIYDVNSSKVRSTSRSGGVPPAATGKQSYTEIYGGQQNNSKLASPDSKPSSYNNYEDLYAQKSNRKKTHASAYDLYGNVHSNGNGIQSHPQKDVQIPTYQPPAPKQQNYDIPMDHSKTYTNTQTFAGGPSNTYGAPAAYNMTSAAHVGSVNYHPGNNIPQNGYPKGANNVNGLNGYGNHLPPTTGVTNHATDYMAPLHNAAQGAPQNHQNPVKEHSLYNDQSISGIQGPGANPQVNANDSIYSNLFGSTPMPQLLQDSKAGGHSSRNRKTANRDLNQSQRLIFDDSMAGGNPYDML